MDGNRACRRAVQRNLCITIIMFKVHRTITTIIIHLEPHPSQQNFLLRFTTSNLCLRKRPSSHADILGHSYTKLLPIYLDRTRLWMINLDTHPSQTDCLDSR